MTREELAQEIVQEISANRATKAQVLDDLHKLDRTLQAAIRRVERLPDNPPGITTPQARRRIWWWIR